MYIMIISNLFERMVDMITKETIANNIKYIILIIAITILVRFFFNFLPTAGLVLFVLFAFTNKNNWKYMIALDVLILGICFYLSVK